MKGVKLEMGRTTRVGDLRSFGYHETARGNIKRRVTSIHRLWPVILAFLFLSGFHSASYGADTNVTSITALNTAISNASRGDAIILADGSYSGNIVFDCTALNGTGNEPTESEPVIVRAETPGGVTITSGNCRMSGKYLIFHGFYITASPFVYLQIVNAQHCRVTNCKFENNDNVIELRGTDASLNLLGWAQNNRIDHCEFKDGTGIVIENFVIDRRATDLNYGYDWIDNQNLHNKVDHCFFNGHRQASQEEAIQIGRGDYYFAGQREAEQDNYMTIEYNYFKNYYGDNELISVKSSSNSIRFNVVEQVITSTNYTGHITLRGGNDCVVEGNIILYTGNYMAGNVGVRVYGKRHTITGNYMEGVFSGVRLASGQWPPAEGDTSPFPCVDVVVADNTIRYGYYAGIELSYNKHDYNSDPDGTIVRNNVVECMEGVGGYCYRELGSATNTVFENNLAWILGTGRVTNISPAPAGISEQDPGLASGPPGNYASIVNGAGVKWPNSTIQLPPNPPSGLTVVTE